MRAAIQVVSALVSVVTKYLFIQHLRGRVDGEGKENPCCSHRWHCVWAVWMCECACLEATQAGAEEGREPKLASGAML